MLINRQFDFADIGKALLIDVGASPNLLVIILQIIKYIFKQITT